MFNVQYTVSGWCPMICCFIELNETSKFITLLTVTTAGCMHCPLILFENPPLKLAFTVRIVDTGHDSSAN